MRCTNHSVTRLHRIARDSPLQLMGSPGAQPMHWQPEFPLSGSLPSILLPQACPATALTHAHNTGPYPSLSLTLPGSSRQCSGVTPSPLSLFFSSLQLLVLWAPPGPHTLAPYGLQLLPSWDTRSHGRNACLTRMPLSALRVAPAALPATRGTTPAAYGCPVCAAHSLVRHPQPMSATRVPPAAGPATCAAPAASARTLAPARYVCLACDTRSLCLPCVLTPAAYACIVCSPAALDCNACNTRKHWPALCEHPRMVRDACLSPNPGGAARTGRLLAVHLHAKCQIYGWVPPSAMAATCVSPANPCLPCVEHPQPWACTVCSTRSNCSQLAPARYVCLVCDTPVYNTCSPSLHSVTLCSSWLQRVQHLQTLACIVWTPAHGATSRLLLSLWTCDAYPGQGCLQDGHLDTDYLWCICILTGQLNGLCHQLGHSRHWTLSIAGLNQLLTYSTFGLALSPSYVRLFGE